MTAIANYFAALRVNINREDIRNVDKTLLNVEKRFKFFGSRTTKEIQKLKSSLKNFTIPALKIKAFKFDNLALQRNAQKSLNQTGRLLELKISNFTIDQSKLNREVDRAFKRAAYNARMNIRTIGGSAGGSPGHAPIATYGRNHLAGLTGHSQGFGMGIAAGGLISHYLAPSAMAYGAYRGYNALYTGNADSVSNRHLITNVVADPNASYGDNSARGKQAYDYLYKESNRLGLDAKSQAEGYAKTLAAGQASGLTTKQSQQLFTNLSEHAVSLHLDSQKQNRLLYAMSQVLAKGQVMSEELKQQIGESSPTLPAYFAKAWAEQTKSNRTGAEAYAALMKAMEKGEVKSAVAIRALELAAKDAKPALERSTRTSAAEANRARNIRSYTMNEASIEGVEDGFYRVNSAIRVFAEDLAPHAQDMAVGFSQSLGAMADFSLGLRALAKGLPNGKQDTLNAAEKLPWMYLAQSNPVALAGVASFKATQYARDKFSTTPTPLTEQAKSASIGSYKFSSYVDAYKRPIGIFPNTGTTPLGLDKSAASNIVDMRKGLQGLDLLTYKQSASNALDAAIQNAQTINNSQSVSIGDINLSLVTQATNGPELLKEVQSSIKQELQKTFINALVQSPQKE